MEDKFEKIKLEVEKELSCSAHNMDHIMRVHNLSLLLAEEEDIDLDVLRASALLHDIARVKEDDDNSGNTDHAMLGAEMAVPILQKLGFPEEKIKHIQDCIISHRYRTGNKPKTKEAEILFDADKLDASGAIGIARGFFWYGKNRENVNIFQIDIKVSIDRLYTEKAKQIGEKRIQFHRNFLDRMEKEENGEL